MNSTFAKLITNIIGAPRGVYGRRTASILLIMGLIIALSACGKEPEYIPGLSIQGYRAPVSKVLFSPVAFDGATLALEGFVVEKSVTAEDEEPLTTFKLSDLNGNTININMPGEWEFEDGDYMIVGGVYRRNGNMLEAEQFEKVVFVEDKKDREIEKRDEW